MKRRDPYKAITDEDLACPLTEPCWLPPRLAAAIRDVWLTMPEADRKLLVWERKEFGKRLVARVQQDLNIRWQAAACIVYGKDGAPDTMLFDRWHVERLTDEGLRLLVAHELAHVFRDAVGDGGCEEEAVELAAAWGFRPAADSDMVALATDLS